MGKLGVVVEFASLGCVAVVILVALFCFAVEWLATLGCSPERTITLVTPERSELEQKKAA